MMRFLVDNSLSPRLATLLTQAKHDAVHVRDLGLADASDEIIFSRALSDNRIILTQDTDFGTILGLTGSAWPSVLTFRCRFKSTEFVFGLLQANLAEIAGDLERGACVTVEDTRVRVRLLPIVR